MVTVDVMSLSLHNDPREHLSGSLHFYEVSLSVQLFPKRRALNERQVAPNKTNKPPTLRPSSLTQAARLSLVVLTSPPY